MPVYVFGLVRRGVTPLINAVSVVMLTTEGDPGLVRRARDLGAKGWLVKPFQANLLVATVQRLIAAVPS